jgi:hypothetical protein
LPLFTGRLEAAFPETRTLYSPSNKAGSRNGVSYSPMGTGGGE